MNLAVTPLKPSPGPQATKRLISIQDLLVWAFRTECAQLEFSDAEERISGYGYASATAAIIQHEMLGCRVDGGGRSQAHPDADLVAAAVAFLSEGCGGQRMALDIAELARAGQVPNWMPFAQPHIHPADTHTNRYGCMAKVEDAAKLGDAGWPAQPRRNRKGYIVHDKVTFCPVTIRPSPAEIARARRVYSGWYLALFELKSTLQLYVNLSRFEVSNVMPLRAPWKKELTKP